MKFLMLLGLVGMFFEAIEKKHFLGQIIKSVKTRKEDLEVNWKKLEEAEKKQRRS